MKNRPPLSFPLGTESFHCPSCCGKSVANVSSPTLGLGRRQVTCFSLNGSCLLHHILRDLPISCHCTEPSCEVDCCPHFTDEEAKRSDRIRLYGGKTPGSTSTALLGNLEVRGQEQAGAQKALGILPHQPCVSGRADTGHNGVHSAPTAS